MPVVNANSVNPDQTPRSAASDLGLRCLAMSHLWDARHKNVKGKWYVQVNNVDAQTGRTLYMSQCLFFTDNAYNSI